MKIERKLIVLAVLLASSHAKSSEDACIYDAFSSSRDCVHRVLVESKVDCADPLKMPLSVTDPLDSKNNEAPLEDSLKNIVEGSVFLGDVNGRFLYKHKSSGQYFDLTAKEHQKYLPFLPADSESKVKSKPGDARGYVKGAINEISF